VEVRLIVGNRKADLVDRAIKPGDGEPLVAAGIIEDLAVILIAGSNQVIHCTGESGCDSRCRLKPPGHQPAANASKLPGVVMSIRVARDGDSIPTEGVSDAYLRRAGKNRRLNGGETGIRTLDRVSPIHAFQACAFNHSAISPGIAARPLSEPHSVSVSGRYVRSNFSGCNSGSLVTRTGRPRISSISSK
jgi:hypothetical protein